MAFSRPLIEHFAAFEAQQNPLEDVRAFVQAALLETALEKKAIAGLMLAVEEAVTNTIRHGYMYGPGRLHVRVRSTRQWVSLSISDKGRPYTVDTDAAPDPRQLAETGRKGGLGLYLMQKVSDHVEYRRIGDENILTMIKRFRPETQSQPRSGLRRRVIWTGSLALAIAVSTGALVMERQTSASIRSEFFGQWSQFGRSAAAATGQHFLNDRSDAEFDQLVVGLKSANPGLAYLIILSAPPSTRSAGGLTIRAHSESPELVHEQYAPPEGVPPDADGRWLATVSGQLDYHFSQSISLDGRRVGMVAWGVPESRLSGMIHGERVRIARWSAAIFLAGVLLIWAGSNWITRPIQKLLASLRTAGTRGMEVAAPTAGPDEIREVVAAFNDATESVAQSHRQMAERDVARREMEASQQLQRALLPSELPRLDEYEFGATCRMARQVGGDYYDIFPAAPGQWLVVVADVAGKGFPAALLMTSFRTATRLLAPTHSSPADLLNALHRFLVTHHPMGPFVTACCVSLDTANHKIEIASAGHTPFLYLKAGEGKVIRLNPKGRPIGVFSEREPEAGALPESQSLPLEPGDSLLLFTDGASEARSGVGENYGLGRLESSMLRSAHASAASLVDLVIADIDRFTAGASTGDDLTVLALRRIAQSDIGKSDQAQRTAEPLDRQVKSHIAATF